MKKSNERIINITLVLVVLMILFLGITKITGEVSRKTVTPLNLKINFQPGDSEVPIGYLKDDGSIYDLEKGYGWDNDLSENAKERNFQYDKRLDTLVYSEDFSNFRLDLQNGWYRVVASVGDPMLAVGEQYLIIEDETIFGGVKIEANKFLSGNKLIQIKDNKLDLKMKGTLNYLEVKRIFKTPIPRCQLYDGFSYGYLDSLKWKETSEENLDEHDVDSYEFKYHIKQNNPKKGEVKLEMLQHNFVNGESVQFDLFYNDGYGNICNYIEVDEIKKCILSFNEKNVKLDEYGKYRLTAKFLESEVKISIKKPNGETEMQTMPLEDNEIYVLSLGTRVEDKGILHIDYDNVRVCR